ncbi:MAG: NifU family protein [Deltaproteobacteria bacterium]|nr:NifU family protein [Deltaproteobacteria bacterium]
MLDEEAVRTALEEIRPALQADGGDVSLVKIEGNDVYVRLEGACHGCPAAGMTLLYGVARVLREHLPEIGEVYPV